MLRSDPQTQARLLCERARQHLEAGDRVGALDLSRAALVVDQDCFDAHLTLAALALAGDHYLDLLSRIHKELAPGTYLEIGIGAGTSLALAGPHTRAIGIDPDPELLKALPASVQVYRETSDEFFARRSLKEALGGRKLDLAFIDGMHLFEFALRDFINVERNATPDTVVFYHDCYPLDEVTAARNRVTKFWTGDVWKLTTCLRKYRPDLRVCTLAAQPTGLGMVLGLDPASTILRDQLDAILREFIPIQHDALRSGKQAALNLVPGDWNSVQTMLRNWRSEGPQAQASNGLDMATASAVQALSIAFEHHQGGRLGVAESIYRKVLETDPDNADALGLLGRIVHQKGDGEAAIALLERATRMRPDNPFALNFLGEALSGAGGPSRAAALYARALAIKPDYLDARVNLGVAYSALGQSEEAAQCFRHALAADPNLVPAHNNLGNALRALGRFEEAEQSFRAALARNAQIAEIHGNLGATLADLGRFAEAERCYLQALAIQPGLAGIHDNLGLLQMRLGRLKEAEASYRRALLLAPQDREAHGNLVALMNYLPDRSPQEIYAEHREFARRFAYRGDAIRHANDPDPERRLRVGYVSGDLRDHSVAFFISPVIESHDRDAWEVFCYYNFPRVDPVSAQLKAHSEHWRDVVGLSDDALAQLIREDAIDVLVDLSGHTAFNRLLAFSRKPAPVQATWLGYLNTTGFESMDYRITDPRACPPGTLDACHSELVVRLPNSQWCYRPPAGCPDVAPAPSITAGHTTFAVLSNLAKINPPMINLWSQVLLQDHRSRMILAGRGMSVVGEELLARFRSNGIDAHRLTLLEHGPFQEYLALHGTVDIVLDTSPYSGGTTTCHALWLGVPVVTLAGMTATSSGGASLLHAVGLPELVARSPDRYVDIAGGLAGDTTRLAVMRAGMRERMRTSPLMDERGFTRNLEVELRLMWRNWCNSAR